MNQLGNSVVNRPQSNACIQLYRRWRSNDFPIISLVLPRTQSSCYTSKTGKKFFLTFMLDTLIILGFVLSWPLTLCWVCYFM